MIIYHMSARQSSRCIVLSVERVGWALHVSAAPSGASGRARLAHLSVAGLGYARDKQFIDLSNISAPCVRLRPTLTVPVITLAGVIIAQLPHDDRLAGRHWPELCWKIEHRARRHQVTNACHFEF